jgi:hypothetical protein
MRTVPSGESRTRTPAFASFESNIERLSHLFRFISRGGQHFVDEMKANVAPQIERLCTEISRLGRPQHKEGNGQETDSVAHEAEPALSDTRQRAEEIGKKLSNILEEPVKQFTSGLLTIHLWIPVILVTIVEAYLKDVNIFAAKVDPAIMESSEQSVTYAEVVRSQSIEELTEEMQSRWARKFVDDGGPNRWIDKLTRMGARDYDSQAASEMETLWGVRHVIVHSAGVATPDFVRRHPDFGAKVGESIVIRSDQLIEWISVISHFVDVTDFYFVKRCRSGPISTT